MTEGPPTRRLEGSPYVDDDGSADLEVLAKLRAHAAGEASYPEALAALVRARVLVPVVALLGEVEHDEAGRTRDKSSDMATVLLTGRDGRRALLAFSGIDALRAWDPQARPVPVACTLAAATAVQEDAAALVVDVGTDHALTVAGDDLSRVAAGWRPVRVPDGGWAWARLDSDRSADSPDREQLG